jgi:AraC-like DNA-binding protein
MHFSIHSASGTFIPSNTAIPQGFSAPFPGSDILAGTVDNHFLLVSELPVNGYRIAYAQLKCNHPGMVITIKPEEAILLLVLEGALDLPHLPMHLTRGFSILLFPSPGIAPHNCTIASSTNFACIFYPPSLPCKLLESYSLLPPAYMNFPPVKISRRSHNTICEILQQLSVIPLPVLTLNNLCLQLLDTSLRDGAKYSASKTWLGKKKENIRDLESFIITHLSAENHHLLNIAFLSKRTCISPHRFNKLFREIYRMSFGVYLLKKRMETALHLLQSTGNAIGSIAFQTGYADFSSFTRAFKKYHGFLPSTVPRPNANT